MSTLPSPSSSQPSPRPRPVMAIGLGLLLVFFLGGFAYASVLFFETTRAIALNAPQWSRRGESEIGDIVRATGDESMLADRQEAAAHTGLPDVTAPLWSVGSGQGRINILLLGIDQRPQEKGYYRTDTMIVFTIDPASGDIGMLSIPRDLWVTIPGYGEGRINTAHVVGDLQKRPGGGPALAKETVAQLLGQPIHYYIRINFEGFLKILNEIGCIEIDVPYDINDPTFPDNNYGYDPFYIKAGHYCMDAETALKYARTRHADSDFGRMERQQQVILAIKNKILSAGQLPHLIARAPVLLTTLADSVQTDIPATQQILLANLARRLNTANLRRLVIDRSMAVGTVTASGASVLMPQMEVLRPAVEAFFNPEVVPTPTPVVNSERIEQLRAEQARIAVLNGTLDPDLGRRTAEWLSRQGFLVVGYGPADRTDYAQSQIVEYRSKPFTLRQLVEIFAVGDDSIHPAVGPIGDIDIQVIIGADFRLP
jgi:LCP family protein required for cell wall assembly